MARARLALEGLSVGDGFGYSIFIPGQPGSLRRPRPLPRPPWVYTDDTVMALGIVEVLGRHGRIDQDELARVFARRYAAEPDRGYGPGTRDILEAVGQGAPWRGAATGVFSARRRGCLAILAPWMVAAPATVPEPGRGSLGNGGAMRVAPVGGYFAEDIGAVVAEARASAEVTHAHPDGVAGAVAVVAAAAWAWQCHAGLRKHTPAGMLDFVLEPTPAGPTHDGLARARALPADTTADRAGPPPPGPGPGQAVATPSPRGGKGAVCLRGRSRPVLRDRRAGRPWAAALRRGG
jgi:hypothetical protein